MSKPSALAPTPELPIGQNGHIGGNAKEQLRAIIERVERLEEEKKATSDDIRDVYAEAKGNGFDAKALRTIAAADFMSGRTPLFIMSLRSGAGLDGLEQVCNTVVFGEMDWSPGIHNQIIWRLRRAAQKRWPVNAIFCHANGGADPVLMSTLGLKGDQARGIERPGSGVENVVSDQSRIKALARAYLERSGGLQ